MKAAPFLAFGLAMFTACGEPPERRYEKMADGACECMTPLVELNEQAQTLLAERDTTTAGQQKLATLFRKMAAADSSAKACSRVLLDKYGPVNKEEWATAEPFFLKNCPKMGGQKERLREMMGE